MEIITLGGDLVHVSFGFQPIKGLAEESGVTIEPSSPSASSRRGLGGAMISILSRDRRATVVLKLFKGASGNQILNNFHKLDQLTGKGLLPFATEDRATSSRYFSMQSRIIKPPSFDSSGDFKLWNIELFYLLAFEGD